MADIRPRRGKFAKLRDAYKAARDAYRANPCPETLAVYAYLENARVASILLSKLRRPEG